MVRNVAIFLSLLVFSCCSHAVKQEDVEVGLLAAVPSDAVAVVRCQSTQMAVEILTPEDCPLREIDFGRLSHAPAAVSLSYVSSLVPLLIIDAGKDVSDTTEAVSSVLDALSSKGLPATLTSFDGRRILLTSTSDTVLPLAQRHIDIDASIVDADGFDRVLETVSHSKNALILRNSAALRLLKGGIPELFGFESIPDFFNMRSLSSFIQGAALWTAVDLDKNEISPVLRDDGRFFCNLSKKLPGGKSVLEPPDSLDFSLEIITGEGFRQEYEAWLDASSKIEPYKRALASLRKQSGKDPIAWEKEMGVGEVARICWEGHEVVLLGFPGAKVPKKDYPSVAVNQYPGFIRALYYSLPTEDGWCARSAKWAVYGNENDVKAYLDATRSDADRKQEFSIRIAIDGFTLISHKGKTQIIRQ